MRTFLKKHALVIACILFVVAMYGPYIAHGGLIIDDWAVASSAQDHPGIIPAYQSLFEQFSNRPLAPLIFSLASNAFGESARLYIILNLALWLAALIIVARLMARHIHPVAATLFFLFAAVPVFSSTVIFSPAVLLMGSASVLLWAISLQTLIHYIETKRKSYYVCTYALLLAAIFSYEATLPLLAISALIPLALDKKSIKHYFLEYLLPILIVVALVLLYQKFLIPHFGYDISRLRFRGLVIIPAVLSKFFFILITDIPALLGSAVARIGSIGGTTIAALALTLGYLTFWYRPNQKHLRTISGPLKTTTLAILSTILLYFLAGTVPTIHGYDNRGLIGCGVALAILLALIGYYGYQHYRPLFYGIFALLLLTSFSFSIERDNYIKSAALQSAIIHDAASLIESAKVPESQTILVNVPTYLPENYSNETIFSDEQDAKIAIPTQNGERAGIRMTKRRIDFGRVKLEKSQIISDDFNGESRNTWYYSTDTMLHSSLVKVTSEKQLALILAEIAAAPAPNLPYNGWQRVVEWSIKKFNLQSLQSYYQTYRSRWGYN